jgi:hypothetical protein
MVAATSAVFLFRFASDATKTGTIQDKSAADPLSREFLKG